MAKLTVTIEDTPDGKVKIVCDPPFSTIAQMINSGEPTTSAHGYALAMLRTAREESKSQAPTQIYLSRVRS